MKRRQSNIIVTVCIIGFFIGTSIVPAFNVMSLKVRIDDHFVDSAVGIQMSSLFERGLNESGFSTSCFSYDQLYRDFEDVWDRVNGYDDLERLFEKYPEYHSDHLLNHSRYPDEYFDKYVESYQHRFIHRIGNSNDGYPELYLEQDLYRQRLLMNHSNKILGRSAEPTPKPDFENGTTWYVGGSGLGNFSKIQDAINASMDGDTVFVYSGFYKENLVVNKSIILLGENKNSTIIDGGGNGDVIYVEEDCVSICNFFVKNSGDSDFPDHELPFPNDAGIDIRSDFNTIRNNIICINRNGLFIHSTSNNITKNFIFDNDKAGIECFGANNNTIYNNNIDNNGFGISFRFRSDNNLVVWNNISNNGDGICSLF
ncbi:MAG: NosD domain-containing protein, partial [Candidatus Thermoplasmatota archaeon]|nr:NosD domain-containing protein [Candidatus Thermoplasmatota archaeon]